MARRTTSVLFIARDRIAPDSTSPARRPLKLAEAVGEHCRVTLAAPSSSQLPDGPFQLLKTDAPDDRALELAMSEHDVVVTQTMPSPRRLMAAIRNSRNLVVDVLAPFAFEASEISKPGRARQRAIARWRARELVAHLAAADLVVCSNEKQRDLFTGTTLGAGLLAVGDAGRTSVSADRIVVVPPGIDDEPPRHTRTVLRGIDSVKETDRVAVWAGGAWGWMDPVTPVKAIEKLRERRPELKLVFVGTTHPDREVQRAHESSARAAIEYARDRGLESDGVVSCHPWLPREDYLNVLLEADVGVATARPTLESRFASRTRVVDYLAAGLPVVCSANDSISAFVERHGLGRAVEPLDVQACAAALDELTAPGGAPAVDRATLEPLRWRHAARPLIEYCLDPGAIGRGRTGALAVVARQYPSFARAVYSEEGGASLARALLRRGRSI